MSQSDVIQIKIGGHAVGIMGLEQVMEEMAQDWAEKSDQAIQDEFLKRLSRKNYIPDKVKESYAKAFLREFKKFWGEPYEEEAPQGTEIKVLGPGCIQCDRLEQELINMMAEIDLAADLEHVTDVNEIGRHGVMGTPALIINGEVKSVGRVPPKNRLVEWLTKAQNHLSEGGRKDGD